MPHTWHSHATILERRFGGLKLFGPITTCPLLRYATTGSVIVHRTTRVQRARSRRSRLLKPQVGRVGGWEVGLEPTACGLWDPYTPSGPVLAASPPGPVSAGQSLRQSVQCGAVRAGPVPSASIMRPSARAAASTPFARASLQTQVPVNGDQAVTSVGRSPAFTALMTVATSSPRAQTVRFFLPSPPLRIRLEMSVIAPNVESMHGKHEKPKDVTDIWTFRAVSFGAAGAITFGAALGGGAIVKYDHHPPSPPGSACGVATYGHVDPDHSDPGGEFSRVETAGTIGTATIFHTILVPSG